jgi:outer membrane protein assembly factor BamB
MVGVVTHIKLDTDWVRNPPKVLWRRPCVEGYSGLAVAGNVVLTMEQRGGEEAVVCYDRATGRQIWAYPYDAFHKDQMGNGPRATPTIHDGLIFTLGATGELVCLNAKKELQWSHNILRDADAKKIQWGMTGSPLIVNDLVIAHAGVDPDISPTQRPGTALIAYDYKIGEKRWAVANRKAGYSSPQLVTLAKVQQILLFDGEALGGFDPKTGKQLWMTPWITKMDMNMIQPVIIGDDQVFISSELDNGCALLQIKPSSNSDDPWTVETVWKTKSLAARFANPVYDGKNIYGLQFLNGVLRCVDVKDGSLRWSGERYGPGQMLLVNDVLLIVSDKGEVSLLATDTAEPKVLARFAALDEKTWNTPTLAGDQLFIRNQKEIVCLKLPRK